MTTHRSLTALHLNLQRLLVIRLIIFLCQVVALLYAHLVLALDLPYAAVIVIFIAQVVINGGLFRRLQQRRDPGEREFFIHLLFDIAGLSILLYLTGGATNPFVSYYLVPVTIAAATLGRAYTGSLAVMTIACYTVLLFVYRPLPDLMPVAATMPDMQQAPAVHGFGLNLHVIGMWINFLVSAALITWFVVRMAREIRLQEAGLSRYREETLRNEQIIAVAIQAAGTAHELGTPLGTMAVILRDMELEQDDPEALDDIRTMQQQVARCRDILQQLASKADFRSGRVETLALDAFVRDLHDQWQLLRPEVPCEVHMQAGEAPMLQTEITMRQALVNILNNAADASPGGIVLKAAWDDGQWQLRVLDSGEGISRELAEHLGVSIQSTKKTGMGVGLVLSQATINRLGGKVSQFPRDDGGTLTEIVLPLTIREQLA